MPNDVVPATAVPPSTILVVDDSATNLQVLVRTLEWHRSSHPGRQGWRNGPGHRTTREARSDAARRHDAGHGRLRCLPDPQGATPRRGKTAVIFLSARGEVSDKVSGLELGAADYITKPIQERRGAGAGRHAPVAAASGTGAASESRSPRSGTGERRADAAAHPARGHAAAPDVSFAAYYETSRHAGGDYYDVLPLGGDRFAIMVADVSGHGAPAAIVMAMIRAVLHTYPGEAGDPPAVLHHINRHFRFLWDTAMYATAIYGVLDVRRGTFRVSSAGHPLPLIVRHGHEVTPVALDNVMCLLWDELGDVPCLEQALHPGDRLVFYTDGITERQGQDGMYDPERLTAALARVGRQMPAKIVEDLVADLAAFAGGQEADDDQTLLVVGIG